MFAGQQQTCSSDGQQQPTRKQVRRLLSRHLALPGASGVHKHRQAAQDTHPFKKFFFPVDPHNAAEVSLFMSLYTEHKGPQHLKAFQAMAAHWNTMKWVQRNNSAWLGITYKDGVQLRNFHRSVSAETGRIESLQLAGLLQASPPSSPSPLVHQAVADASVAPAIRTAGLVVGPAAHAAALYGSGLPPAAPSPAPTSGPSPNPSPNPKKKKKRRTANTTATQSSLWPGLAPPGAAVGSGPSTSAPPANSAATGTNKQNCPNCWLWDWWKACKEAPRFHGPGRVDPMTITRFPLAGTGHRNICPHKGLFNTVFMAKQSHLHFDGLSGGWWTLFDKCKKGAGYHEWLQTNPSRTGWKK